jgi:glutaredoxin 3
MSNRIVVYGTAGCPFCQNARKFLSKNNVPFDDIVFSTTAEKTSFYDSHPELPRTVPPIFLDGESVGGYTDLMRSDLAASIERGEFSA